KVLVVSVPRLQWDAVPVAPALTALFERGAVASLSIRTVDAVSTLDDGYLTIGAGNRASLPTSAPPGATDQPGGGVVVDGADVAAIGLLLDQIDEQRDLVLLVAPAAPDDAAELTTFAIAGPGIAPGRARSATTRRDGYVTLPDVGVTVLDALGVDVPAAMNGTEVTSGGSAAFDHGVAEHLADTNTVAVFRDKTVGPVSTVYVILQILTYAAAIVLVADRR